MFYRVSALLVFMVIASLGCGACCTTRVPTAPAAAPNRWYTITIQDARLSPRRLNNRPWDKKGDKQPLLIPVAVELARILGTKYSPSTLNTLVQASTVRPGHPRAKLMAPDPRVELRFGRTAFITSPHIDRLRPLFNTTMLIDAAEIGQTPIDISVHDLDHTGHELIGRITTTRSELLKPGPKTLVKLPNLHELRLWVKVLDRPPAPVTRLVKLEGKSGARATGIEVLAGQRIYLQASGKVCVQPLGQECHGIEGIPNNAFRAYNLQGMASFNHGQLVAVIGGQPYAISGPEVVLRAQTSGPLVLAINDSTWHDNSGRIHVVVSVYSEQEPPRDPLYALMSSAIAGYKAQKAFFKQQHRFQESDALEYQPPEAAQIEIEVMMGNRRDLYLERPWGLRGTTDLNNGPGFILKATHEPSGQCLQITESFVVKDGCE